MTRWDFSGGIFLRLGRWWVGLFASWPFIGVSPVIAGGSDGMTAQGSYLLIGTGGNSGSPDDLLEISEVTDISGGGGAADRIDFTHLRSPGRRREFKPGFINDDALTFNIQYIPSDASHQRIIALYESGDEVALREVFPDGNGWDYTGYVANFVKGGQTVGGKITAAVTFQLTGATDFSGVGSPA